ncbi:MAG: hypothetical protein JHD02_08450, partial [Thermoleophilaceae bacterium]|nr:hypothetical protein [Thermoleophilaceae bacterium]
VAPEIDSPVDGDVLGDPTPTVSGTAEADSTVNVYVGAVLYCTATTDGAGDWSCAGVTPLAEGPHTLTATATDPSGNEGVPSADVDVIVDLTNPSVSISGPVDGSTVATSTPQVDFSASDVNSLTLECKVGAAAYAPCTSPWTTDTLSDGSHTASVRATDAAGNVAVATTTFTVDTTAPTTTIDVTPDTLDNNPTPTFEFSSNDPGATFECRIDSGLFAACTSPFTTPSLLDGSHTFEVRATDTHGNVESPAQSYTWTLDTVAPAAPVITTPAASVTTTDNTPAISGTAEPNSSVEVFVDGNSIGTVTANGSGNWTITSPQLTDGSHSATARATDVAGNLGPTSGARAFTVDTTPPGGSVAEQPGSGGGGTNPTFDISTSDGTATIACALDGGASAPCSSPFTPAGTLAPGTHTLVVTFTDPVGNVTTRTITFVIAAAAVPSPPPAASDPTQCLGGGVVITNLFPKGNKATVSGFARADLIGKTVTITYLATKKAVATALVKSDGSFATTFKAPPKKDWNKNTTNYVASAGGFKSKQTKLLRRTSSTVVSYSGGKLTVSGAVTLPLVKGGGATIKAKTGCTGTWKVIGTTKFKPNGAFSFSTAYAGSGVVFVQVNAVIGNPSVKNKKFKTNSFVVPVVVK